MEEIILPLVVVSMLFLGLPWIILHHITKWKQAKTLTGDDENMLEQMYDTARKLENRLHTIERIISADHPEFHTAIRDRENPASLETNRRK